MSNKSIGAHLRKLTHAALRKLFSILPQPQRFAIYRSFVDFGPNPSPRL